MRQESLTAEPLETIRVFRRKEQKKNMQNEMRGYVRNGGVRN